MMKEKSVANRNDIYWKIATGIAAAGFVVTWIQPAGPLVAVPFAALAMWLRLHASTASEPEPLPFTAARKSQQSN
jgi:hypothetical protein